MGCKEKPNYGHCVAIVAFASLTEMIKIGALAIFFSYYNRWVREATPNIRKEDVKGSTFLL